MVFLDCIQIVPQIDIFVRSGWANVLAGSWRDAADLGAWWSSSAADTSDRAWRPYIQQSQLNLNTNANRWHGLPLRWAVYAAAGCRSFGNFILHTLTVLPYKMC